MLQGCRVMGDFGGYYIAGNPTDPLGDPPRYFMDDPEPRDKELEAKYVEDFKKHVFGANYRLIGDLFAGRAEFPWIVTIRFETKDKDQELFSTGNIISRSRVLTVCRTVLYANGYRVETKQQPKGGGRQTIDFLHTTAGLRYSMNLLEESIEMKIIYCANFLWLKYKFALDSKGHFPGDHNVELSYEGGETHVRHIAAHPKCEEESLVYDFAVLAVSTDIIPVPPTLTYIPVRLDENLESLKQFDLTKHVKERRLCFVASFGYPYENSPNPKTLDYKMKYRVYWMDWGDCSRLWDLLGVPSQDGVDKPYWCPQFDTTCKIEDSVREHLLCFNTRARIGSVCDHDRGSPLVCDNQVYGFVTRGVEYIRCSTIMHIPFLVVKLHAASYYFRQSDSTVYQMKRDPDPANIPPWKRKGGRGLAASLELSVVLFTGMVFKILLLDSNFRSLSFHH
ncbi:hypothetical protein GE061_012769 [Apolygus lucorum]|uniref:Peptidase S1 domain-containing protein n=1 Tax=Apolygus lucorum TaxID=248454 RepID=A0A8S9XVH1_APOLU|nr:hypothetical protein GE061_012769 [Apolygus lucorum]